MVGLSSAISIPARILPDKSFCCDKLVDWLDWAMQLEITSPKVVVDTIDARVWRCACKGGLEAGSGGRLEAGWRQAGGKLGPGWSQISLFGQHFRRCGYTWHSSVAKLEAKTVPRAGAAESRPRVKLLVHLCKQN